MITLYEAQSVVMHPVASTPHVRSNVPSSAAVEAAAYDAELVKRFNGGDESAFVEIAERHRRKLFQAALGFVRNESDAEEVAQDALVRAHRSLRNFRGDSSLATWLHRVACNLARNRYWHSKRRGAGRTFSLESEIAPGSRETFAGLFPDTGATASQEVAMNEFQTLIATCMEKLEHGHREILTLASIERLSYGEISQRLNTRMGTVKSRIARARTCLAALLALECPDFGEGAAPMAWFESMDGRNVRPFAAA